MKLSNGIALNHQVVLVLNNQQRREGDERALEGENIAFIHSEEWIAKPNSLIRLYYKVY